MSVEILVGRASVPALPQSGNHDLPLARQGGRGGPPHFFLQVL